MGDYITYDQLMRRWEDKGKELRTLKKENAALKRALVFARQCEDEHGCIDWDIVDVLADTKE